MKKFNNSKTTFLVAFILCISLFTTSLIGLFLLVYNTGNFNNTISLVDAATSDSYESSINLQMDFSNKLDRVSYLYSLYTSEVDIKDNELVEHSQLYNEMQDYFYQNNFHEIYGGDFNNLMVREQFFKDQEEKLKIIMDNIEKSNLINFEQNKKDLDSIKGFSYYMSDGKTQISNVKGLMATNSAINAKEFYNQPVYLIYENGKLTKEPGDFKVRDNKLKNFDRSIEEGLIARLSDNQRIYMSFSKDYVEEREADFQELKTYLNRWIPLLIGSVILTLVLFIYLLVIVGRRDEEENIDINKFDQWFTEVKLLAIAGLLGLGASVTFHIGNSSYYGGYYYGYQNYNPLEVLMMGAFIWVISAFGLAFILSVVKTLKVGIFLENSLLFKGIRALGRSLSAIYHGGSIMRKIVLIALVVCLLSATIFLAPVVFIALLIFAPKWVKKYEEVRKGIVEVKNGNLSYTIPITGSGELDSLAEDINEISQASSRAVQNELKNQRLKTDLISNVSHDLKTPLTSIITYIDLLKNEGLHSEEAPKYLEILDQKADRLKKLTDDLFDAAKASSGAIPVNFEKVELLSLINQGLGELSPRIAEARLEFKIVCKQEKYYVNADGQLLWRVIENLLNNVIKYAQEGSRVYIDVKNLGEKSLDGSSFGKNGNTLTTIMEMKNISKMELNIHADELMERFKRGDESRTTEGSGLGLAIAKDLVKLQNGWFEVKIDGDLFKAVVMLETAK